MERRAIRIQGVVQGVGYRPFVHGLATRLALAGFVQNLGGEVRIEVEGAMAALDRFVEQLTGAAPPLARVDGFDCRPAPVRGEHGFRIAPSAANVAAPIFLSPDVAVCAACLAELFDPGNRRFRYPFINCTHCGPRLTIITAAPYDRERTTMARFAMCRACRAEYDDPGDRRFHAEPIACPACGPRLQALSGVGATIETAEPLAAFVAALRGGKIGAIKGLGGYHLACDARQEDAVAALRQRKHREEKPFALMVPTAAAAEQLCVLSAVERDLLESSARPIVLLRRREQAVTANSVAPGHPYLGIMLPYTPLHHLLLRDMDAPLVMTSGNRADEPIATDDAESLHRLAGIADIFLANDRPIHVRCDDSVTRVVSGAELPLRRSRGYAPQPIALPVACVQPILAVGGQFKGTFALGRGRHAFVSHHLGDLDHLEAYQAFACDIELYQELFAVRPQRIAHDLHPDYASTRYAQRQQGCDCVAVQHHHAHMASCMAEHGLEGPVIGVIFDGTGYGTDAAIWGGEFLVGDYAQFRRAGHLRYVGMPGAAQAIREPWRMALAHVRDAAVEAPSFYRRLAADACCVVERLLDRGFQTPLTSSVGRLFDAVAVLITDRDRVTYEGQAAVELEGLATASTSSGAHPFTVVDGDMLIVDTRPLVRGVVADVGRGLPAHAMARRFHNTIVEMVAAMCGRLRQRTGLERVVLSGGVFCNALLGAETPARLRRDGFAVFSHQRLPPNDGGLSLGQLTVAAAGGGFR